MTPFQYVPDTDKRIAEIEAKMDATEGPWESRRGWEQGDPGVWISGPHGRVIYAEGGEVDLSPENADFCASASQHVPYLIDKVRELRRRERILQEEIDELHNKLKAATGSGY